MPEEPSQKGNALSPYSIRGNLAQEQEYRTSQTGLADHAGVRDEPCNNCHIFQDQRNGFQRAF